MKIAEIYAGIEGEGSRIGNPQTFIRLQGCKVGCTWCDTKYAQDEKLGEEKKIDEIVQEVEKIGLGSVSITGGNPLEQAEQLLDLIKVLNKKKFHISIEATGQEFNKSIFDIVDFISCDIKPPSSKVKADLSNIENIFSKYDYKSQFKIVVADKKDLDFACEVYNLFAKNKHKEFNMLITPCWPEKQKEANKKIFQDISSRVISGKMRVKVVLQQHKIIYSAEAKGV